MPRPLRGVTEVSTACEVLGGPVAMPILVAPVALQRLVHREGELAMARAAAAAGTVFCHSTLATTTPAEVAAGAPPGRRWLQLYPFRDAGVTRALTEGAVAAGYEAVVLTVDAPPAGKRERDFRTGFRIPPEVSVPSLDAALGAGRSCTIAEAFELMDRSLTWEDLGAVAADAGLPLIVKGVIAADDAALAVEHGAAAVVVSNHGGRQLDRCPGTAEVLAEAVEAVDGRAPVLVDGGIRRGIDVATALALGAEAVLVGRPTLWGLAAGGAAGARRVLELLAEELALALALCGAATPGELTRDHARSGPAASVYSAEQPSS